MFTRRSRLSCRRADRARLPTRRSRRPPTKRYVETVPPASLKARILTPRYSRPIFYRRRPGSRLQPLREAVRDRRKIQLLPRQEASATERPVRPLGLFFWARPGAAPGASYGAIPQLPRRPHRHLRSSRSALRGRAGEDAQGSVPRLRSRVERAPGTPRRFVERCSPRASFRTPKCLIYRYLRVGHHLAKSRSTPCIGARTVRGDCS